MASLQIVYLIRNTVTKRIKIGTTRNITSRLQNLQTGNEAKLQVEAQCGGDTTYERQLHKRFAKQRVRGEWFTLTEDEIQQLKDEFKNRACVCEAKTKKIGPWKKFFASVVVFSFTLLTLSKFLAIF